MVDVSSEIILSEASAKGHLFFIENMTQETALTILRLLRKFSIHSKK